MGNLAVLILASMLSASLTERIFGNDNGLFGFVITIPGQMCGGVSRGSAISFKTNEECLRLCLRSCSCYGGHYNKVTGRCTIYSECYPRRFNTDYDVFLRIPEATTVGRNYSCNGTVVGTALIYGRPTMGLQRHECFIRCKNTCGCRAVTQLGNLCTMLQTCTPMKMTDGTYTLTQLKFCDELKCRNPTSVPIELGDVKAETCTIGKLPGKCIEETRESKCPKNRRCAGVKCKNSKLVCCLKKKPKGEDKKICEEK